MKLPILDESAVERLPPLYDAWVRDMLGGPIPRERKATCASCPLVAPGGYHPDTKCCTFQPHLANFLVGSGLSDPASEGTLQERMRASPHMVSPLGLLIPRDYLVIYEASGAFGRARSLRCPHYDSGGCGIWAHRNSVCATWFCGHNRPVPGSAFWDGLRDILMFLEDLLALWALLELGFPSESAEKALRIARLRAPRPGDPKLSAAELDREVSEEVRASWRGWGQTPDALYRQAHRRVAALGFEEISRMLDPAGRFRVERLRAQYAELVSPRIPRSCTVAEVRVEATSTESFTLIANLDQDTLEVPLALLPALAEFRQGSVPEALERLAARGTPLSDELVQELFDHGVLRPGTDG